MSNSYLIVGGSSDIGIIVAKILLEKGNHVTLYARDETRVKDLESLGASIIIGDALDNDGLTQAIEHTLEKGDGKISGIAHLVGSIMIKPPHAMTVETFNEVINTNLTTAFLTLSLGCLLYTSPSPRDRG